MDSTNICQVFDCMKPWMARGYCAHHYYHFVTTPERHYQRSATRCRCMVCGNDFPERGGKRTCSTECSQAYRVQRQSKRDLPITARKSLDRNDKAFILDRISVDTDSGCWNWDTSVNPQTGYGQVGFPPYTAHKLSFFLWNGRYPNGVTRHSCHNRRCCNPEHLSEGSHRENWEDSADAHRVAAEGLRGRSALNSIAVSVDGVTYPSKAEAMKVLSVSFYHLERILDSAPCSSVG